MPGVTVPGSESPHGPPRAPEGEDWLALTPARLPYEAALEWVARPDCGAVTSFLGIVRDHAEGRTGVVSVDYEAYDSEVVPRLAKLAASARARVPQIGRIVLWHRTGNLALGEASVVVVVSAPHRGEAFEACRFLIDTLKVTLPIWKNEHHDRGTDWSPASHPLQLVPEPPEPDRPSGSKGASS
jgi:molybdopterin synthase catalytic subunit